MAFTLRDMEGIATVLGKVHLRAARSSYPYQAGVSWAHSAVVEHLATHSNFSSSRFQLSFYKTLGFVRVPCGIRGKMLLHNPQTDEQVFVELAS